ncbi:class E sortase [Dactylosporangium vinaceum]|uniref:Class E sortase n=1 Tax=Dactylosporangium vinaceum TaxID=53362 RepID=A0ABV5MPM6_9ACTN|nr:class E sortase [Dactylosporangium vinaceum]UAB96730.1 class E sortase [Dactylosporangium vinaceum]
MDHAPRHRALDQDDIATTVIPKLPPKDDATAVIPKISDATAYIPKIGDAAADPTAEVPAKLPPPTTPAPTPTPTPEDEDQPAVPGAPKGVTVVPLRPVRTEEGYRSVYSEYTRTSFGSVARAISRGTGEVLITFGLIVLLFAGYEVWGKSAIVDAHQDELNRQLEQQWAQPTVGPSAGVSPAVVKPANGDVIASVHIPRLNKKWAVVQGVTPADIRYAPGHYPDTALPGQIGNFSMAGHRTPAIWWDLDQLKAGDSVVIKTADTWYVYSVTGHEIVLPTAVQVVAPVPDKPGEQPTKAMLTMTTCNPKFNNYQRLVVHAEMTRQQPVTDGDPAELKG